METKMTPRQLRQEIDTIDQQLHQLEPWVRQLTTTRNRYVLRDEQSVVALIDNGKRGGEGRPDDPDLEPFDRRMPGLRQAQATIATLNERRALLVEQLPSKVETAAKVTEAEALATDIRTRAEKLVVAAASLDSLLREVAGRALALAEETRSEWESNVTLDRLCGGADIARPPTPLVEAPKLPVAAALRTLLSRHFNGTEPHVVDPNLTAIIRAGLAEAENDCATVMN